MKEFVCPRCSASNSYKSAQCSSGYDRCYSCGVAIEWKRTDGEVEVVDSFVPDGYSVSPKTGRVLGAETGWKVTTGMLRFYSFLRLPGARDLLRRKQIEEGMLER